MRKIRLYCDQSLQSGATIDLDAKAARHALQVLRLKNQDTVTLFNGDGMDYPATLEVSGRHARAILSKAECNATESALHITLVQGISRSEKMDFTLQKATELGITRIQPVFCRRSIVNLNGPRLEKKLAHWASVVQSACEQSGRSKLPSILQPLPITQFLAAPPADATLRIMLDPSAGAPFTSLRPEANGFELLIGPEGGFDEAEIDAAQTAEFHAVSLGPRILRTETAGLASIAILQSLYGDLN